MSKIQASLLWEPCLVVGVMPKRLSIQARDKVRDMGKEKLDKVEPGSNKLLLFDSFVRLRISSSTFGKKSIYPWKKIVNAVQSRYNLTL